MSDIRKWFMKQHDKGNASAPAKPAKSATLSPEKPAETPVMEMKPRQNERADVEEDYLLLDLDSVCVHGDIPANASYVLSGLDTLNPVLTIANHLKLIGEYQETMGTCYVFSERDGVPQVMHSENHTSETNFQDTSITNSTHLPAKEVKLITGLHKVLKFRLASEDESLSAKQKQC